MGLLTRQTREELSRWELEPAGESFAEFLDDVAERSFKEACESRYIAQGPVLAWIAANEGRSSAYATALQIKAEVLVHESIGIVDDEAGEVPRGKLRTALRLQIAGHWNDRYRARVQVDHAGEIRTDAGLTMRMGELLERVVGGGSAALDSPPVPDAEATALPEPLALPEPAGAVEDAVLLPERAPERERMVI